MDHAPATAVSSTHNEMFHEPVWQKTERGWTQSTPFTLDTRGRTDPTGTAASCTISCNSFTEKEEVVMIELTQMIFPVPAAVTEQTAYLRVTFGNNDIERGVVEPYNAWYTEAIPLSPMSATRIVNLRDVMQDARTLRYFNKGLMSVEPIVTLRLFTLDTAGQPVDFPYAANLLPANNFTATIEMHTFKK